MDFVIFTSAAPILNLSVGNGLLTWPVASLQLFFLIYIEFVTAHPWALNDMSYISDYNKKNSS